MDSPERSEWVRRDLRELAQHLELVGRWNGATYEGAGEGPSAARVRLMARVIREHLGGDAPRVTGIA